MSSSQPEPFELEYQALRTGKSYFELKDWSSISVAGADRQKFLNNFCTNDTMRLAPGTGCEAFFTNVKGKIVGHGLIWHHNRKMLIFGAPGQTDKLIEHLDRYVIREDVQLTDNAKNVTYFLMIGGDERRVRGLSWDLVGRTPTGILELTSLETSEPDCVLTRVRSQWHRISADVFTSARIEAGFPLYGIDFNEENLPQEIDRDRQAISFTKGCYLGQETGARIDALGHVNQKLVRVRFTGSQIPPRDTELIADGKTVGRVTSAAFSPKFAAPLAFAMIRREANAPGTNLKSSVGEFEVVAS